MGYTLCVLGCGTMGLAVLSGVLESLDTAPQSRAPSAKWESHTLGTITPLCPPESKFLDPFSPSTYIACVSNPERVAELQAIFKGLGILDPGVDVISGGNVKSVEKSHVILLCCKPQLAQHILNERGMKDALEGKLLISILAGVTISQIRNWVSPSTRVIRAMPNTPCKIREGMTIISAITASPDAHADQTIIMKIFSSIGRCRILDEKHFDACTALSGSGPAFACIFMEAMADGGVMMGLPRAEALELASQTLQGAARMVLQGGTHPAQLKDAVTTPGGCTIAGLLAMEDGKIRSTIARAIQVATDHASLLGQSRK